MKLGRNDPCSCGSGKKFKHCCQGKVASLPQTLTPAEFNQLVVLFNTGRYVELESKGRFLLEIYPNSGIVWKLFGLSLQMQGKNGLQALQKAVELLPNDAEAHSNLGIVLKSRGQLDAAAVSYRRALKLKPDFAEGHNNLGNVLKDLKHTDDSIASYRRALKLKPDFADAHNNMGVVFQDLGQLNVALESFNRAIELKPDFAEAHYNLGKALKDLGQLDGAEKSFCRAIELKPDFAEAYNNLGVVFQDLGQLNFALASFNRAIELKPDFAEAHYNLGKGLYDIVQLTEAVKCFCRAIELKPDVPEAHFNLGNILKDLSRHNEAVASYRRAIELKPDFAEAYNTLGIALKELGRFDDAVASYRQALEVKPDYAEAHSNLGNALKDLGQLDDAISSYRRALEIKPDLSMARSNMLFVLNYIAGHTPEYYLEQARQFGQIVAAKASARFTSWECPAQPERLRVGVVSGDMWKHSVGFFLEGLFTHVDPASLELIAYPTNHEQDELTARIRPYLSDWKPIIGMDDEAAAHMIHADGVHVLIDLSGHTAHNRLPVLSWKPAPVQVTWLGLPATSGVAEIDYVLGDPYATPPEFDNQFSEDVWRMPDTYLCLTVPASSVSVAPLPALAAGSVTFGSFNNLTKMNDAVVAVWARILKSVPNSCLYLKAKQLSELSIREHTCLRFASCGITPDRLILGGGIASKDDHLDAYNKVDIALDTFPYPGVTTSFEALWMGVPVLSLQGDRFLSRTAGSIACNAGLPDWIAADEDDYVAKAVAFSSDLGSLAALRSNLRKQVLASPLFDAPRFARNFEDALWGMWQTWYDKQSKGH